MIIGIGCDIVEHEITRKRSWDSKTSAQKRVFTQAELNLYSSQKKLAFLSGRFAAKEAILKCIGTGMQDGIALTDIEILQDQSGKPVIELHGKVKIISDSMSISAWHISITHSKDHSIAFVIAESL